MESRLSDLNKINFNIMTECEKLTKYLGVIRDKSEETIFEMQSLNPCNFLRKYYSAFEYLNQFNMKLVDINCLFELFILELDNSLTDDTASNSVRDLSSAAELNLQSQMLKNCEQFSQPDNRLRDRSNSFHHRLKKSLSESCPQNDDNFNKKCESIIQSDSRHELKRSFSENQPKLEDNLEIINTQKVSAESISNNNDDFVVPNVIDHSKENATEQEDDESANTRSISSENQEYLTGVDSTRGTNSSTSIVEVELHIPPEEPALVVKSDIPDKNSILARIQAREQQHSAKTVPIPDLRPMITTKKYNNSLEYFDDTSNSSTSNNIEQSIEIIKESLHSNESKLQMREHNTDHFRQSKNPVLTNKTSNKSNEPRLKHIRENNFEVKLAVLPVEEDMCYISHIESPSSFYIQIISEDNTLIDYLSEQIEEILPKLQKFFTKREARKLIIDYCVFYLDECKTWYRGLILDWKEDNEEFVEARRVDYGDKFEVPLINIRHSIPYFYSLPIMAKECELAWAAPVNNAEEWSEQSIECFKKIVYSDCATLFFVCSVENVGDRLIVDLRCSEIASLAGELITSGHAVDCYAEEKNDSWSNDFMVQQVIHSQGFSQRDLNMTEEEKLNQLAFEESDEEVTDPTIAVAHYRPQDEIDICRIFLARGYCFKGDNCRFSHTPLNPDGWTTDKEQIYFDTLSKLQLPADGQEITLKIVSIVNLNSFYVAFKNWQSYSVSLSDSVKTIKELVTMMNDPDEIKRFKRLKVIPALGELVLVKFANTWQRGKVLECTEFGNRVDFDVFLVDLGMVLQNVNMKEARCIQENHLCLPFQTMLCFLANIQLKEDATEEETERGIDYLEMHVLRKSLRAKVHSSVTLTVDLFTQTKQNIGDELVKAGLVQKCNTSILPSDGSNILVD